jgi:hypothetical protein
MWTAIVGFSGTGKTPGIDATKLALAQIERNRKSKIAELRRAHEARKETAKASRNHPGWSAGVGNSLRDGVDRSAPA